MSARLVVRALSVSFVLVAVVSLAGCGGGSSALPADAVARVGAATITKATLDHWMSSMLGGDYYEIMGEPIPEGLVSEPPHYTACVARLKAAMRKPVSGPSRTAVELKSKCEALYQAVKVQALTFLVGTEWRSHLYSAEGVTATEQEARQQLLKPSIAEPFTKAGGRTAYLADRRWALSDEIELARRDILQQRLLEKLRAGGSRVLAKLNQEALRWTAQTTCRPGYVVEHCKQYVATRAATHEASPAILIEQLGKLGSQAPAKPPARDIECKNKGKEVVCEPVGGPVKTGAGKP